MTEPHFSQLDLALASHALLPPRIRHYLNARGIPDWTIDRFLLGWSGGRIRIPIYDKEGNIAFFKLARDPEDPACPKMLATKGSRAELYGWERLTHAWPMRVVVCEGEFDRLVLESRGFAAVTSTAGAGVFKREWTEALRLIPEVYVCFDLDEPGRQGALKVAGMIPGVRIVELPPEVGLGGDVTDFFVRLGKSRQDFLELLRHAKRPPPEEKPRRPAVPNPRPTWDDVAQIKASVRIEDVVRRYLELRSRGSHLGAHCPFHKEKTPSFVVFPQTQSFYCFGCQAHGDVIEFLRQIESLSFREALDRLRDRAA